MDYNQPNPLPIGFVIFDPATLAQRSGSWGVGPIQSVIPGQSFSVPIVPDIGGTPLTPDQVFDLHIVPSVKEIFTGYTLTPVVGGFVIDFGAVMVNPISISIAKIVREITA